MLFRSEEDKDEEDEEEDKDEEVEDEEDEEDKDEEDKEEFEIRNISVFAGVGILAICLILIPLCIKHYNH